MLSFCIYCLSTHSDACKEINREKKVKLQEKSTSLSGRYGVEPEHIIIIHIPSFLIYYVSYYNLGIRLHSKYVYHIYLYLIKVYISHYLPRSFTLAKDT